MQEKTNKQTKRANTKKQKKQKKISIKTHQISTIRKDAKKGRREKNGQKVDKGERNK